PLEKPHHNRLAIPAIQTIHRIIQHRRNLRPRIIFNLISRRLHETLLFTPHSARLRPDQVRRRQASRAIQPARQHHLRAEPRRLARQHHKHRLCDLLGLHMIAHPAQCRRINQVHMLPEQLAERVLGAGLDILPQQRSIIRSLHLQINVRRGKKVPKKTRIRNPQLPDSNPKGLRRGCGRRNRLASECHPFLNTPFPITCPILHSAFFILPSSTPPPPASPLRCPDTSTSTQHHGKSPKESPPSIKFPFASRICTWLP